MAKIIENKTYITATADDGEVWALKESPEVLLGSIIDLPNKNLLENYVEVEKPQDKIEE